MDEMETKMIVGIDLGTTYSAIAHFDEHGQPEIIPNADSERITPSVIYFGEEEIIVGRIAKNESVVDPDNVVQFVKRYIGDPDKIIDIREKEYTPETLSAIILRKLVNDAEKVLGLVPGTITDAVITVPAYFNDTERKATQDAGEIAGLNVIATLNEPTAAALAYGVDQVGEPKTVLVYDLGGGTFDVTIIKIDGKNIEVVATDGERKLGGKDFDDELINYVSEKFIDEIGIDPRDDLESLQDLQIKCEEAKIILSRKESTRILVQCQGNSLKIEVTRSEFENLIRPLVEQTETYLGLVLNKAEMTWEDIDEVLCVGGSTKIPMVRDMLRKVTDKTPNVDINPDEVVSLGAVYYAGLMTIREAQEKGEEIPGDVVSADVVGLLEGMIVENVNSHSLGIVSIVEDQRRNFVMIPAQTKLPAKVEKLFKTAYDNQISVNVDVIEGSSADVDECTMIGTLKITDLPSNRPKGSIVRVIYVYDMNGRVQIYARDEETGNDASAEILRSAGLTSDQVFSEREDIGELIIE